MEGKKKLNAMVLLFLLVLSMGFVYSATTSGSFSLEEDEAGAIVIRKPECYPNWECPLTECIDGSPQTYVCYDRNQCGFPYPSNHEETISCTIEPGENNGGSPSVSSGGGGSSGGSKKSGSSGGGVVVNSNSSASSFERDCVENWVCSEWTDIENSCGNRVCIDTNNCGVEESKPVLVKECESKGFFSFITGGVIGAFGSFGWWVLILFLVLIIAFFIVSKRKKKESATPVKKVSKKGKK